MNLHDRWPTWQRDLVAGLLGATLASAVLLPLSGSRVRAERERAEAAEREAAEARAELLAVNATLEKVAAESLQELKKSTLKLLEDEPDPQRRKELMELLHRLEKRKE